MSRKYEENYLTECLTVIKDNIARYQSQVDVMSQEIEHMYKHYHSDSPELYTELSNTITMYDSAKLALEHNKKALAKPYFGRIDFHDYTDNTDESLYIGKGSVNKTQTELLVIDWRAPVANIYYENGLGNLTYHVPGYDSRDIDLKLKRTYEIQNEQLINYFDSEVVANDELLMKYLSKTKEAVLGEIIATIQKEQNDIIRRSPFHNTIVQGVAGSGKTTVAMHRISYILYNYPEKFKPKDFYIIGSNHILLNYITGVLPDLEVYDVPQMTMEDLFIRLMYEDWNEKKFHVTKNTYFSKEKGGIEWFNALKTYCDKLERDMLIRDDVVFGGKVLFSRENIEKYINNSPTLSILSKIKTLNEVAPKRLKEIFRSGDEEYSPNEKKAILAEYKNLFGANKWKLPITKVYLDFVKEYLSDSLSDEILADSASTNNLFSTSSASVLDHVNQLTDLEKHTYDIYDLASLAFLHRRLAETEDVDEAHHIVIDEAQDYGVMTFAILKYIIPRCTFTIMGDISQNINYNSGMNDWEILKNDIFNNERDTFDVLAKSYRNTIEISEFAQKILKKGSFTAYPIEPVIRHGNEVSLIKTDKTNIYTEAANIISAWQKQGLETIAIICRDEKESSQTQTELSRLIKINDESLQTVSFSKEPMVLPVQYTKGLEFDAVLLLNPSKEAYPADDANVKLMYVATTRALHELTVLYSENISELLL